MSIIDRIKTITERFNNIKTWEDKYKELITLGKEYQSLEELEKDDKFKVKGCTSQVWLLPRFDQGKIFFKADSDSTLVKGIVSLLVYVYSDSTPDEIISNKPEFLKEIGIMENLTMNRSNGLASMMKQIQMYALVYKTQIK